MYKLSYLGYGIDPIPLFKEIAMDSLGDKF